ncbi:MAG TPA: hypothetical protein VE567_06600, partial [Sphingomonas sp.]|nr:hypothetical protein [Sphingomonas sp.]
MSSPVEKWKAHPAISWIEYKAGEARKGVSRIRHQAMKKAPAEAGAFTTQVRERSVLGDDRATA